MSFRDDVEKAAQAAAVRAAEEQASSAAQASERRAVQESIEGKIRDFGRLFKEATGVLAAAGASGYPAAQVSTHSGWGPSWSTVDRVLANHSVLVGRGITGTPTSGIVWVNGALYWSHLVQVSRDYPSGRGLLDRMFNAPEIRAGETVIDIGLALEYEVVAEAADRLPKGGIFGGQNPSIRLDGRDQSRPGDLCFKVGTGYDGNMDSWANARYWLTQATGEMLQILRR